MTRETKNAAHAVDGSTGGRAEQGSQSLVSADSVPETGRVVKSGGPEYARARRLAAMLTERQMRDILRLALVIREAAV